MTEFKTISILKYPVIPIWSAMLSKLPEIANQIDDLESIIEQQRTQNDDGKIEIVNQWNAKPQLPSIALQFVKPGMLSWVDYATWNPSTHIVNWKIESSYFKDKMICEGTTNYEPAMGGKGCRITFAGTLGIEASALPLSGDFLGGALSKTVESIIAQLIPSNFKKISSALETYVQTEAMQ